MLETKVEDVLIGINSIIMGGVTTGKAPLYSRIRSYEVPPNTFVVGNLARVLRALGRD